MRTPEMTHSSGMTCPPLLPEYGYLLCAGKAPRRLSGSLGSTAQPQCNWEHKRWNKGLKKSILFEDSIDLTKLGGKFRMELIGVDAYCYIYQNWQTKQENRLRTRTHCHGSHNFAETITAETLWEDLKPVISYLPPEQLETVEGALKLAFEAHDGQKRKSGEPYIVHPVEVARILGELELDWETIVAGLLHDTVEDTNIVTFANIEDRFGSAVRRIVEGETKVSKLGKLKCGSSSTASSDVKADDLRQMFLAMTEEVRVIIVKLADRLHNMRTLMYMPPKKQQHIAIETLQIFAPLARLLGMNKIKSELEDLSFKFSHPNDYMNLKKKVNDVYRELEEEAFEAKKFLIEQMADAQFLSFMAFDIEAHSFCKELYCIYRKLLESNGSIGEVQDISQLRIILKLKPQARVGFLCNSQQLCYHVLGLVHQMWTPVPQSVKDYIATPKPNGYQSLHTKVLPFLYENTFRLEVQIRTEEMDILAERGIAAYYSGKVRSQSLYSDKDISMGVTSSSNEAELACRVGWLNAIREWQEEFVGNMSAREFVDTVTGDLLGSRVFVFTPKGEIKNLPKGAAVIDYAYHIHTELGNKMVAAKVNGNLVSPVHTLANAQIVEILTYEGLSAKSRFQRHKHWLQYAKTRSARHKITKFLKEQAALFADELTADAIDGFVSGFSDSDNELFDNSMSPESDVYHSLSVSLRKGAKFTGPLSSFLAPFPKTNNMDIAFPGNLPKVNGKHDKHVEKTALQISENYDFLTKTSSRFLSKSAALNLLPMHEELMAGLEAWQAGGVTFWQSIENKTILWLNVFCIDRSSMLGEVSVVLGAAGVLIKGCAAETDRARGLGVMLFNIEASTEILRNACVSIETIGGVLSWSVGCSWQSQHHHQSLHTTNDAI